jgi:hypothetical protein
MYTIRLFRQVVLFLIVFELLYLFFFLPTNKVRLHYIFYSPFHQVHIIYQLLKLYIVK